MRVRLDREVVTDEGTLGRLSIDGAFLAYSLEPGGDEDEHPPIPAGHYDVIINQSTRFGRRLPLIVNVPGRLGIRVHPGNVERDTSGCILLGYHRNGAVLTESAAACTAFQHMIAHPLASHEDVTIDVFDPPDGKPV